MRPVDQTTFGPPDGPPAERGNCFAACLATILHFRIEEVPQFHALEGGDWSDEINNWLDRYGLHYLEVRVEENPLVDREYFGIHVLNGFSPRNQYRQHSVVARGAKMIHDPFPTRKGLLPHDAERSPWTRGFLIPHDPRVRLR